VLRLCGFAPEGDFTFILGEVLLTGFVAGVAGDRAVCCADRTAAPTGAMVAGRFGDSRRDRSRGIGGDSCRRYKQRGGNRWMLCRPGAGPKARSSGTSPGRAGVCEPAPHTGTRCTRGGRALRGVASLTVLLALNLAFDQGVVGSELGGFVVNQVRTVDYLSAALAIVLGAASVGDVLYINLPRTAPPNSPSLARWAGAVAI